MKKAKDKEISDLDKFYYTRHKELHQLLIKLRKKGCTKDQLAKELIIQESIHLHMLYEKELSNALQAIKKLTDQILKQENLEKAAKPNNTTKPQVGG